MDLEIDDDVDVNDGMVGDCGRPHQKNFNQHTCKRGRNVYMWAFACGSFLPPLERTSPGI